VYYDPAAPDSAVLENHLSQGPGIAILTGAFFLVGGLWALS
jgi:hypothetical protein